MSDAAKIKASEHESYSAYTVLAILMPPVAFIVGIIFMTKKDRLDRKLGEHLVAFSVLLAILYSVLWMVFTAMRTSNLSSSVAGTSSQYATTGTGGTPSGVNLGQVATPSAQPTTLLDLTGNGTKQTQKFSTTGDWTLAYSYDCTAQLNGQGNFQVYVYNDDGSLDTSDTLVNELGASGSDTQYYYDSGTHYLEVNSECSWHVTVKG